MPKTAPRPWKIFYVPKNWKKTPILYSAYATEEKRDRRYEELRKAHPETKWARR